MMSYAFCRLSAALCALYRGFADCDSCDSAKWLNTLRPFVFGVDTRSPKIQNMLTIVFALTNTIQATASASAVVMLAALPALLVHLMLTHMQTTYPAAAMLLLHLHHDYHHNNDQHD